MREGRERRKPATWTTENEDGFRGARDSVIETHRPDLALDPGRRSPWRWVLVAFLGLIALTGAGAFFYADKVAAWFYGDAPADEPAPDAETSTSGADSDETGGESGPSPSRPTGESDTGAAGSAGTGPSTGSDTPTNPPPPTPTDTGAPPHAWPLPAGSTGTADGPKPADPPESPETSGSPGPTGDNAAPAPTPASTVRVSTEALSTSALSRSRVERQLDGLADAVQSCLVGLEAPDRTYAGRVDVVAGIKWNGRLASLRLSASPASGPVERCVRAAFPRSGFPQPPPGKDGRIKLTVSISPR